MTYEVNCLINTEKEMEEWLDEFKEWMDSRNEGFRATMQKTITLGT